MTTVTEIVKMIDHSLLHPTLTDKELKAGCELAIRYNAASCCVKPFHTKLAAELLKGSSVLVGAVIGFPHGNNTTAIKVAEAKQVIADGAVEVDMVINVAKALQEDWDYVEQEIGAVVGITKESNAALKVIFATDFLEDKHIIKLCEICTKLGVDFVKTSTGYNYVKGADGKYSYKGATTHVLKLMLEHTPSEVQVKAAGACSTLERILEVREWGVTRVGTGQTEKVAQDAIAKFGN